MSTPDKIAIGEPYYRQGAICVPVKMTFPDESTIETIYNWNAEVEEDEIIHQLKGIWDTTWRIRKKKQLQQVKVKGEGILESPESPELDKVSRLKGRKINVITGLEDDLT